MRLLIAVLVIVLSGCGQTGYGNMIRSEISTRGAAISDEGITNAVWFFCSAASVGSVRRYIGDDAEKARAYDLLCEEAEMGIGEVLQGDE